MTLWIEQPVSLETKQQLLDMFNQEKGQFRIDLNRLLLTGTVTRPSGVETLKNYNLMIPALVVRGPIRTPEDGQVQPWETLFGSPTIYNNIGERIV